MDVGRRQFMAGAAAVGALPVFSAGAAAQTRLSPRSIAVEEAFATPEQLAAMARLIEGGGDYDIDVRSWKAYAADPGSARVSTLMDIDAGRLALMDEAGLDMQVLSLTSPGVQPLDADTAVGVVQTANDRLAEACRRHPSRFAGLASFAPQDPARAAREIERAMTELKLNGLIVNSHTKGEYLDEPKFEPILEAAEALGAAIYIHPRIPPREMVPFYTPPKDRHKLDNGEPLSGSFATFIGFTEDTLLHGMRLLVSGVFDRYPRLKIVLGHMGEGLPFYAWKLDSGNEIFRSARPQDRLQRKPSEYLKDNFLYTTSGFFAPGNLDFILRECGPQTLMFAIDYPYYSMKDGMAFLSGLDLEPEVLNAIAHGNAERVFRIPPA